MRLALPVVVVFMSALIAGQAPAPATATFEVAAIRENTSGATGGSSRFQQDGRWTATNVSVALLIAQAYGIPTDERILNVPDWARRTRYDIQAIGSAGITNERVPEAVRALLQDRFQMRARVEKRDLPAYDLVLLRADGQLGPGLRPAAVNCGDPAAVAQARAANTAAITCGIRFSIGGTIVEAGGAPMQTIALILSGPAGRPVTDKTGLSGAFDLQLRHSGPNPDAAAADAVSVFTAAQEQLGLRLVSSTAPLDVVIVERLERPSEN